MQEAGIITGQYCCVTVDHILTIRFALSLGVDRWWIQLSGMHEALGLSPRTAEEEKLTHLEWVLFEVLDL